MPIEKGRQGKATPSSPGQDCLHIITGGGLSADKERDSYLTKTCNKVLLLSLFTEQYVLLDVEITSYPCTNSLGVAARLKSCGTSAF